MTLKILIVTQYYPPETGAPQARLHELAQRLIVDGIKVEVLTAMPNYPEGRVFAAYRGKWLVREEIDDVPVVRVPIYPTNKTGVIPRFLNYFSFVSTSVFLGVFLTRRPDIVIIESPPLFLGLAGIALSWLKWSKLVLNISDLWPESITRLGALNSKPAIKALEFLEWGLYRAARAIIGQSEGIVMGIRRVAPRANVELIPNGCDCENFHPHRADVSYLTGLGLDSRVIVGYAGLIGIAQGIGVYLEMARRFREDAHIGFLLVGNGPEYVMLKRQATKEGLENIVFLGRRPKSEMPCFVAAFDLSLVPLVTYIPGALPSKLYELMASETPIVLAAGGDPEVLIERAGAGIVAPYDDPDAIEKAIRDLANNSELRHTLGQAGRTYTLAHHDRNRLAKKFRSFLVGL
jgi:glycosyltransferase involved in cell wall biosynthesis